MSEEKAYMGALEVVYRQGYLDGLIPARSTLVVVGDRAVVVC